MGSETASEKANLYNPNPIQNRTGNKKMNFTNTDSVEQEIYYHVNGGWEIWQVYEQVNEQLYWLINVQIIPTQTKIKREI
jgi:hypothetical protein